MALGQFPLTLITAFGVPLATGAHIESLKRLRARRVVPRRNGGGG